MASRLVAAASSTSRLHPSPVARLVSRRGLADQPWTPNPDAGKVNLWEDPMSPMRWKSSHFVVGTLTVWAALVSGGIMIFGGEKEIKKAEVFS